MPYQYIKKRLQSYENCILMLVKYMADELQMFYYNQMKARNSIENAVDNFWLNLLPDYFQKKLKYGIEHEARPLPGILELRADWTICYVKNGIPTKLVLMEDKRKGKETQSSAWKKALDQLTKYLKFVRTEELLRNRGDPDQSQVLYGAVNIGTYSRFYQLDSRENECVDYPGTNGKVYELAADEVEIHRILLELVSKTAH